MIGADAPRLPNTSNIAFVGLDRQALFIALDQAGVACSTGSACASGSSEPSPAHLAMGLDEAVISSALRFSFGATTTAAEVAESSRRILKVCNDLRRRKVASIFSLTAPASEPLRVKFRGCRTSVSERLFGNLRGPGFGP